MVRKIFKELAEKENYIYLEEQSLLRSEDADTFFIGASIMAHMDIFNGDEENTQKYYTIQRTFSATRLGDVGYYPLATPFEVMMSIFRVNDISVKPSIKFVLEFLKESINININQIIFLAPHELNIRNTLIDIGIDKKNIVTWEKNIPLNLGCDKNQGFYLKMFVKYKHGIIPCATIGYIEQNGKINVDSALFVERLDFISNGLTTWYEGKYFKSILLEIEKIEGLKELNINQKYSWANHLRTLLILYKDGLRSNGKGKGHIINKIVRYLASTIIYKNISILEFNELIKAESKSLEILGYKIDDYSKIALELYNLINKSKKQLLSATNEFIEWIENKSLIKIEKSDIERWTSEKGIPNEYVEKYLKSKAIIFNNKPKEKKFWFRNECYGFDEKIKILDPVKFIRESEIRRIRGKK